MGTAYGKIKLDPNKVYCLPLHGGHLDIRVAPDPNYPGLDVEFIADNEKHDGSQLSRPRVLIEMPSDAEGDDTHYHELRALCWANRNCEDYTDEITLDAQTERNENG